MKGRIYDPEARRFLTPDPFVPDPFYSQSHNRYSYVWNNPATLVDPTGYNPNRSPGAGDGSGENCDDCVGNEVIVVEGEPISWLPDRSKLPNWPAGKSPFYLVNAVDRYAAFARARAQAKQDSSRSAFVEWWKEEVLSRMSDDQRRAYLAKLEGLGCVDPDSVRGRLRDRLKPFVDAIGLDDQRKDPVIDRDGRADWGLGDYVYTKEEMRDVQAATATQAQAGALTGNALSFTVFAATGNTDLAAALGGAFDALGGAAKAHNGVTGGRFNTVDQFHGWAYGPHQPNSLKDY
jgi:hypothetical protein